MDFLNILFGRNLRSCSTMNHLLPSFLYLYFQLQLYFTTTFSGWLEDKERCRTDKISTLWTSNGSSTLSGTRGQLHTPNTDTSHPLPRNLSSYPKSDDTMSRDSWDSRTYNPLPCEDTCPATLLKSFRTRLWYPQEASKTQRFCS